MQKKFISSVLSGLVCLSVATSCNMIKGHNKNAAKSEKNGCGSKNGCASKNGCCGKTDCKGKKDAKNSCASSKKE